MNRAFLASVAALACACNSAPKNSCTLTTNAVVAAGTQPSTCNGNCVSLTFTTDGGDGGGTSIELCTVDCTDGGDAVCNEGTACAPIPLLAKSYCVLTCGYEGGVCPNLTSCTDAGVCL